MSAALGNKVVGAAAWVLGARMVVRASGLISIMILARLLPPEDFGIVGLTVAFIAAFEAMSDMSLHSALVRHPNPKRVHFDTVFALFIIRGVLMCTAALLIAEPLATFYNDERLAWVARALAIQQLINGFSNPGMANFMRDFEFRKDFAHTAVRKLGGVFTCIALALTIWPDYRALVAGTIASALSSLVIGYILSPYRPKPSLGAFKELFGFSKWMVVHNLTNFFYMRADTLIIGKTLGMTALGIQAVAIELANLVATEFAMPLQRAFMPSFAKVQDRLEDVRHSFGVSYGAAMAIAIPFAVGVAAVAEPAIRLAFGEKWMMAVAPLQILAFWGLASASTNFVKPLVIALGEPRRLVKPQIIALILGAPLIWYASLNYGLIGAAWVMFGMSVLFSVMVMRDALRLIGADAELVMTVLPRALGAALCMVIAIRLARDGLPPVDSSATAGLAFIASFVVVVITYPIALFGIWRLLGAPLGPERRLLDMAQPLLRKLRLA